MAIDFPNSPATNDTHTVGDKTWIYADGKWSTSTGVSTTNASLLVSGTLDNARLPAVATTITTVGTLGSLAVTNGVTAATFTGALTGNASTATNVAYTGLTGTVTTWNQNTTGTAATVTGAAQTAITSVGTLTGLTVDGASSPSFTVGDWSPAPQYSGITGNTGYLLVGTNASDTAMYLRTSTAGAVNIGANGSNTLSVGNGTATVTGTLTATTFSGSGASLTSIPAGQLTGQTGMWTSANRPGPYRLYRRDGDSDYSVQTYFTAGSRWRLYGYNGDTAHADTHVGFADTADTAGTVTTAAQPSITSVGTLGALNVTGTVTAGTVTSITYIATSSANNGSNCIKLGSQSQDFSTLYGYTAYGQVRVSTGYTIGIGMICAGSASPGGFTANSHILFTAGSTISGDIRSSASNTTTYNTSSDYRLKENITEISDAIERIRQLRPVNFQFKDVDNNMFYDGFLAHEVEDIAPYAVSGTKDAVGENGDIIPQMIDMSTMVGLLTAGIKELDARLAQLETI